MGSASSKFKKYLQHGDEFAAMQVYQTSPDLRENLDPSASYGESHNHNTPLHYAAKHGMKHLVRAFLSEHGGSPNKRNSDDETAIHCVCRVSQAKSPSWEERRTMCMSLILLWRGPIMQDGEKEKPQLNAQDKKGNTALHYAAGSGLRKCVELLVFQAAGLFIENKDKLTPCDMAVRSGYYDIASYLESRMVFADTSENLEDAEELGNGFSDNGNSEGNNELYTGLRAQDLQEAKDQLLVETADMLHIPLFTAEALLRDNEWSKALLLEKWMSNALQCCKVAGIAPPSSALQMVSSAPPSGGNVCSPTSGSIITPPQIPPVLTGQNFDIGSDGDKEIACEICFENMSPWDLNAEGPSCGHRFCSSCWDSYLTLKIQEGGAHHILCPAVECSILVDVDFIEKMVSPEIARKYLQFDIEAFVERNKTIKWCPLPGCGRAVRYPEAELETQSFDFFAQMNSTPKTSHAVDCGNGHFFCWECLGEAHSPCNCDQWVQWQTKVAEIRPEELKISTGETEDAANFLWLMTNSKPCPNCKSPIQKNEGCNHMKCSKCKFVFCWVCLESWKKHSSATGGYFRCNRYEAQTKADEKLGVLVNEASVRNQEMQELSKFIHYYTRYKNHQNSLKLEEPLLKTAKTKMETLAKSLPIEEKKKEESVEKGTKFIEEAIKELLKCRRVLCGSYVYGYYLQDNGYNKAIFEYMQNELEEVVEKLSEMVAREYLVTPRGQIIATTLLARTRRHKFVAAVGRGLLPPETPPALRKERRKRLPTLIGIDPSNEENNINNALTLTLLGKCSRKSCPKPRSHNPQTGVIYDLCAFHYTQQAKYLTTNVAGTSSYTGMWDCCDSNVELLIALEMSRLQMIEDEARRCQSWLQERSKEHREHRWSSSYIETKDQRWSQERLDGPSSLPLGPSTSCYKGSVDDLHCNYENCLSHSSSFANVPSSCLLASTSKTPTTLNHDPSNSWSCSKPFCPTQLSSAEIAVDYFLKKLSNNEISLKNLNVNDREDHKVDKDLFCFPKKRNTSEDGCFRYGDFHENEHLFTSFPFSKYRRDFRRSQSLGDLTDHSSEIELRLDLDNSYQEFPGTKMHLSGAFSNHTCIERNSLDQNIHSNLMADLDSPLTDMEVKGILGNVTKPDNEGEMEPSFQLVVDEGTDKDESVSTELSNSSHTHNKASNLRIHISHPNLAESRSSNEFESETGIPNSPTLYISGVSISRSPEPRSPKSLSVSKENRSPSLSLPICRTPEPKSVKTSPLYTRSRSSSLIVPSATKTSSTYLDPASIQTKKETFLGDSVHLSSSLSLQPTRVSSPFLLTEIRVSRSASEPEKNRLVFQFPKSPTEGALSSVLHVEESTLSSDDFHEALFLGKSPRSSKRKKSKRERNKKGDDNVKKDQQKGKDKTRDNSGNRDPKVKKDKRKSKDSSTTAV